MGKGSTRRSCQVPQDVYERNFESVFGKKKLNVMSDDDRDQEVGGDTAAEGQVSVAERVPFWTGPGYRGEYNCPHGVGHGLHIHGCDGCCARDDFPLRADGCKKNAPVKVGVCAWCGGDVLEHRGEMPIICSGCASDY